MMLSVVVICHNSLGNLRELLPSLRSAMADLESEVIIVDNGSTDGTDAFISREYPEIRYSRLESNRGVAFARNRGLEIAEGEYIWILDDDTVVNAAALRRMLTHLQKDEECGVVACALTDSDGGLQQSYKEYPGLGVKIANILGLRRSDAYSGPIAEGRVFSPFYVIGACQMFRREVMEKVGMLDETIFYGPEDADFCMRVRKAGWRVDFIPDVSIIHKWKRLTRRSPFSRLAMLHIRGLIHFYVKHRRWL